MKFFLDNNVDSAVRRVLIREGHEAWTVAEAGLAEAEDDDLTVYAWQQGAIVVTHDREFSRRRIKDGVHGKHIWLHCRELVASDVMMRDLPALTGVLSGPRDVLIELHRNSQPKWHW